MPEVRCAVSDCFFWNKGNLCGADAIMIEIDEHAEANFNEEFAGESFDTGHQDHAGNSAKTCCHTYKPKKSPESPASL